MPFVIACPSCNAKLKAPENAIGKNVKCPTCGTAIAVRAPAIPDTVPATPRQAAAAKVPAGRRSEDDEDDDRRDEDDRPRKPSAYMGIAFSPDTDDLVITDVYEKSPGEKAGLKPGDVIIRIDGKKVRKRTDFADALRTMKPGDEVTVDVEGDDEDITLDVKLGKRPVE